MRKEQLYDHIAHKINLKRVAVRNEYASQVKKLVGEWATTYDTELLAASHIFEMLKTALEPIDSILSHQSYSARNFFDKIAEVGNLRDQFIGWVHSALMDDYSFDETRAITPTNKIDARARDLIVRRNIKRAERRKADEKLDILKRELDAIVRNYPAKKAFGKLEEVGLDMSDFEVDEIVAVPVPVTLSVPIDFLKVGAAG